LGCDMLSATGRKHLRGPRGTGFLWIRRELCKELEPAMLDMDGATWVEREKYDIRADAKRFECWESSIAGRLGLGVAVRYAQEIGLGRIERRIQQLAKQLREGLSGIDGITVQDRGKVQSGIVTFTHARLTPQELVEKLAEKGITVRISPREATRLDMEKRGLSGVVRASVQYYNTGEELERVCRTIAGLV
jgi:cysteine desulfurase / selenocysteine lyase